MEAKPQRSDAERRMFVFLIFSHLWAGFRHPIRPKTQ